MLFCQRYFPFRYLWLAFRYPDQFPDNGLVTDLQSELSEMISLGVKNITKMLMKKKFKATPADKERKMAEVKAFSEKKQKSISKLHLTRNWFDADEAQNDDVDDYEEDQRKLEDADEPLLADKEKVFQEMIEQSKGAVSRQMLEKIYAQMEKERNKDK